MISLASGPGSPCTSFGGLVFIALVKSLPIKLFVAFKSLPSDFWKLAGVSVVVEPSGSSHVIVSWSSVGGTYFSCGK